MRAVNLLPADRKKRERQSPKLTPLHGAGLGIVLGAVGLFYWGHGIKGQVAEQQAAVEQSEQQAQQLTTQIAAAKAAATAPQQTSNYETDKTLVSGLTAARVNWSTVMVNLSRVAPKGVWLTSMSITTPTSDQASAAAGTTGANQKRPAAITLQASATSRTEAALFLSRLNTIPGFVEPRLTGGINPGGGAADGTSSTSTSYSFTVEIPVDDSIFGPGQRPATPAAAPATAAPTTTPTQP
jgi:Tfp pilus assembly protein PilN